MSYDKNGNITALTRYGDLDSDGMVSANLIDELKYTYDANNANLLKKVLDLSNNPQGFNETADIATGDSDGLTDQTDDYEYDANGNMVKDTNKSITKITYNHLNLPINILFEGTTNGTISYLYNAMGQKLRKKVVDATSLNTTDYLNGFQYTNTTLDFFPHAEGYIKYTPPAGRGSGIYSYVFNYTDHLGNIRVSYGKDPSTNVLKVLEENHYYPFGLKHSNYNSDKLMYVKESDVYKLVPINTILPTYKYKYNGKELQDELGLNMYDYGARNYDPALGRWMNVDPLAEKGRRWSPYNYCMNNPVFFIDPDGMWIEVKDDKDNSFRYNNGKLYTQNSETKAWDVEANVDSKSYVGQILSALNQITGGDENSNGSKLLNAFTNDEVGLTIQENKNEAKNHHDNGTVKTSFKQNVETYTTNNKFEESKFYVTLAHEIAHGLSHNTIDNIQRTKTWFEYPGEDKDGEPETKIASQDEVFATTYENMIREERGLPLRTHYAGRGFEKNVFEKSRVLEQVGGPGGGFCPTLKASQIWNTMQNSKLKK